MEAVLLLIGLVLGVALGAVIGLLVGRSRTTAAVAAAAAGAAPAIDPAIVEAQRAQLDARHAQLVAEVRAEEQSARAEVGSQLAAAEASVSALREQLVLAQDQYREHVERARREAAERQEAERAESRVLQALTPVQETLRTMQAKVTELETQRSQQHGELSQQLKAAAESEERLRSTAESLASALKNNATRGVWGETQLRTLVESAGLINRVDFDVQATIASESGLRRPDMVINLPGGKQIPVDSKVPYNAYIEAAAIPAGATGDQERARVDLLAKHGKQVRSHVDALSSKAYWTGLDASPDFTIAFIPNEPLLAAAIEAEPALMEYAFSKRIILATPGTLWALLKTIAFTWQQDVLTEDAKRLFDLSRELYSRIATMAEHADAVRRSIESTVNNYNRFASSLEQRVLVTARKLDALDESKVIPTPATIESAPKRLTQAEFVRAELEALDETGIAPAEIDTAIVTPEAAPTPDLGDAAEKRTA
ncbi:DNA recombination protein RmuC [Galbitalea sp. SE-J8]|uniref:DNA recombination protein RmuC n=1 Tax=Galbitalea sp. SE-J8 TaxID=3054952 RepID=UPI00259C8D9A|nr:DNA recombination protein RmuC [Galbitalea sp. SE-J8]MDM4763379.1 DNA recombination protein RmuC [Galbitalea sp. SE-J8]